MDMDERSKQVLWAVVETYINNPDPVGSRFVTKKYSFALSPATIRNIMADLAEMGFLMQPHTSAGRVPTDMGYRFYVDSIARRDKRIKKVVTNELSRKLEAFRNDVNTFLSETTRAISNLSHYLGVAMSPGPHFTTINKIELIRYKRNHIAVILITDEGFFRHKIISFDSDVTQKDLNRISEYLNSEFLGYTLDEIRHKIIKEMSREKAACDKLINKALKICKDAFDIQQSNIYVSGLSEVLELPDFADIDKIKEISRAIEDKHTIIKILNMISEQDGVQVIIGSENTMDEMKRFSVVASTYKEGDRPIGVIGIIGPTRMDYFHAISLIDTTSNYITQVLSENRR